MTHLFVSHATADDTVVTRIHDLLESAGVNTWVDHKDIQPADDWEQSIQDALNTCSAALYVLSPRSANRVEIRAELRTILDLKKVLYVALTEHMPPHQFPFRMRTIQYVDLSKDFDGGMKKLIAAINGKRLLDPTAPHTVREFYVTGDISVELTHIPMSGRDADLQQVIAHLAGGYVTSILGVGGLGKSRLAAEVVLLDEWADGAVWHVASDYSTADDALALLREHLALPPTASRADVLHAVRAKKTLIVIDNAESVTDARLPDYVQLVNELKAHSARVLITGRVEWDGIKLGREHQPPELSLDAARQVVLDMRDAWGVPTDLTAYAERIAISARQHPRLIEWSVRKMKKFPPEKVIRELETFKGKDVQAALDGMIRVTVEQMTAQHGPEYAAALRKLCVFRGGFTYQGAGVLLGLVVGEQPSDQATPLERYWAMIRFLQVGNVLHEDVLDDRLSVLQAWQFVTYDGIRYAVNHLVSAAVSPDETARQPHFDYYWALALRHRKQQDYASLDAESDNLTTAFEWVVTVDTESAVRMAWDCSGFLENRGRFRQNLDWFTRLIVALPDDSDELRAGALDSLGNAYRRLGRIEDKEGNLRRAVIAFTESLQYRTPTATPYAYAQAQNNLGVAYVDLAEVEDLDANLRRAIIAYMEALKYWTPTTAPNAYAGVQNNLGLSYVDLAEIEDREGNLRRAITAYTEALKYFTPAVFPLDYAMTQNNLGSVCRELAEIEDREGNLRRAITAYTEALKYFSPASAPLYYAMTQHGFGVALKESGDLPGAIRCWCEAEIYYRRMGVVEEADNMLEWIAEVEAKLNAPPEE